MARTPHLSAGPGVSRLPREQSEAYLSISGLILSLASLTAPGSRLSPQCVSVGTLGGTGRHCWDPPVCSRPSHRSAASFILWSLGQDPPVTGPWGSRPRRTEAQLFLCWGTPHWGHMQPAGGWAASLGASHQGSRAFFWGPSWVKDRDFVEIFFLFLPSLRLHTRMWLDVS